MDAGAQEGIRSELPRATKKLGRKASLSGMVSSWDSVFSLPRDQGLSKLWIMRKHHRKSPPSKTNSGQTRGGPVHPTEMSCLDKSVLKLIICPHSKAPPTCLECLSPRSMPTRKQRGHCMGKAGWPVPKSHPHPLLG